MNLKERLNLGLAIAEDKEDARQVFNREAIDKILKKIYKGKSAIKKPLQSGIVSLVDVVKAIKNKRCLRTPDQDFGATYLEQIIGGAIRDSIPMRYLNQIRAIFGLDKLSHSELVKHKQTAIKQG